MELQLTKRLSTISLPICVPQPFLFRYFRVASVEEVANSILPRIVNVRQGSILYLTVGEGTIALTIAANGERGLISSKGIKVRHKIKHLTHYGQVKDS